ncbi:MAG: hypothetical protein BWK78_01315 [Thiotrichaceae bacterium IS1]|nr:MAG: hypothetical protein BWK78_01315 [Thiotrichaceae bacterium IS1]
MPGPLIDDSFEENPPSSSEENPPIPENPSPDHSGLERNPPAPEERSTSENQDNGQGGINPPPVVESHSESEENSNPDNRQGEINPPPSPNPERSATSDDLNARDESNPPTPEQNPTPHLKVVGLVLLIFFLASSLGLGVYFYGNPFQTPGKTVREYTDEIKKLVEEMASLKQVITSLKGDNTQNTKDTETIKKMLMELQTDFDKRWEALPLMINSVNTSQNNNDPTAELLKLYLLQLMQENMELKRLIDGIVRETQNTEIQKMLEELSLKIGRRSTYEIPEPKKEVNILICSHQVPLSLIDVKNQQIPVDYKYWVRGAGNTFVTERPFFIMSKEITVAEFECFFQGLPKERQEEIGKNWIQDNKDAPVTSISWKTAHEYANWLSQKTGDSWSLPTYNQWLAAVMHSKPDIKQEIVRENAPQEAGGMPMPITRTGELNNITDLLGNVREWSLDTCEENGHYVLGADYMVMRDKHLNDVRKPLCYTSDSITIGFRLIMSKNEEINSKKKKTTYL